MTEQQAHPAAARRSPSMAQVAERAGVSHQTVSRVLNDASLVKEETRIRVLAAIEELGYRRNFAARLLATNRSRRIGMVTAHLALHGPSMIALAVQEAGQAQGYDVSLVGLPEFSFEALQNAVDRLSDQAVEAIVVAVPHKDSVEMTRSLQLGIPIVMVQGVVAGQPLTAGIDQEAGARRAVDHLLDLGHRRVAHVSGPSEWIEADHRAAGWRAAHEARGLLPGPLLTGDWSSASGHAAGLRIAQDPDVTAVFAGNDFMALGVLHALHQSGRRVPEDVSVVGFDDVPQAEFYWPALTTVAQEFSELGRRALAVALAAVRGDAGATVDLIEPTLLVRGSTGPPAH
ncbi:DNA-binding transcriptional regulator, LacI/PurR family [Nocardioides alpinus]|uniref:DNA-binding transcriptional regulator, LacI/PurR family n=1 Tax=Nocardioides alpinus TaxID=748909 RepID=A0A1I0Z9W4_9ACTN|nr:LacI family DNA-binding transcriptional regulator [Nocardioides alpinus]PKH40732.1 LacI family transcriptional regulator [Nocardioides alpinus]SFB22549.1 DNA-binding transcriptional regulator, LacI/PurR family [Nocardioides alpinus]